MKIKAFNDFWLDCYTTILYSILLSGGTVDKAYIYNDFYSYDIVVEKITGSKCEFLSVVPRSKIDNLKEQMLLNERVVSFWSEMDPIELMGEYLSHNNIIMLGVDLYYLIEDNYHYQRNHILHYSLVHGIDRDAQTLKVMETGRNGYQEYDIPYDRVRDAILSCPQNSFIYEINWELPGVMYTKEDIVVNAQCVSHSIEEVLSKKEELWNIGGFDEHEIMYMKDILQTHIFSMMNRQKVSRHLFMIVLESANIDLKNAFEILELEFAKLKNVLIKWGEKGDSKKGIMIVRDKIFLLLEEEKRLWDYFLEHSVEFIFKK